jgi:hypothetical protein
LAVSALLDLSICYRNVISVLKNPFYAGAYAYGKSEQRTAIVDGRLHKTYGHGKPRETCEVLLKDHHEGYIDWTEFERDQTQLAANASGRIGGAKSGRGGRAPAYRASDVRALRATPDGSVIRDGGNRGSSIGATVPNLMLGLPRCLGFGGPRVDTAIAEEILCVVEPMAIEAAFSPLSRSSQAPRTRSVPATRRGVKPSWHWLLIYASQASRRACSELNACSSPPSSEDLRV